MTFRTLIRRSLVFHWRSHLGVVLGAAIGSAALIGALVVGDSVRGSLRERALEKLAGTYFVLNTGDRLFTSEFVERFDFSEEDGWSDSRGRLNYYGGSPNGIFQSMGVVQRGDSTARANAVTVYGIGFDPSVPDAFWQLSWSHSTRRKLSSGEACINSALADKLGLSAGDEFVLRATKHSALPGESPLGQKSGTTALRLRVQGILSEDSIGDLAVQPGNNFPLNVFMDLNQLQLAVIGQTNWVNVMLSHGVWISAIKQSASKRAVLPIPTALSTWYHKLFRRGPQACDEATAQVYYDRDLRASLRLIDLEAALHQVDGAVELRTRRVLLDGPVAIAAFQADTNAQPILTYLANLLRAGTNTTPYSVVTAVGAPWTPAELRDDEIVVSQWLADDLQVKLGDEIAMSYFLPESGAKLEEATNTFRVHSIVPMEMPWADRTLMPDFPGIENADSTRDWDAGFPLTYKIRDKDEDYWHNYRGTPKAFITLAAGQKMWGNRFGDLTAIRFPIPTDAPLTPALSLRERENRSSSQRAGESDNSSTASLESRDEPRLSPLPGGEGQGEGESHTISIEDYRMALEKKILANLDPAKLGFRFEPVREQALKAAEKSQDFGGLFLGFSFFLIAAALLLMAMLFQFGLEQRAPEVGTLLALGFTPKQVRKLLLREGVALAFIGGVIGAIGGIYFAKAMLHGLATIWRDAVGATALSFHMTGQTLVIGLFASVIVSAATLWLALRKFIKRPARELLVAEVQTPQSTVRSRGTWIGTAATIIALGLAGWTLAKGDTANAGAFFGAGALVLIAGLSFASAWLARTAPDLALTLSHPMGEGWSEGDFKLSSLGLRGCARRRTRSLSTVAMLACGSFLIVSIGVFRLDANRDAWKRSSGTGGFALIGETTMPVVQDLNSQSGRDFFALSDRDLEGVHFVPFRVREGDEASCLNLNAAQRPRLLGVKPELLEGRFNFAKGDGWSLLRGYARESVAQIEIDKGQPRSDERSHDIPAIGDANSIQWAMKKKVGDTIDYVDDRGQPFKVRIVGAVANSILQGQLIIDETEFVRRFPNESGYRVFLMDAPSNAVSEVSATLSRALQDVGLEVTPAADRLAQFNSVQNTYLGTFQILGGLGMLLGSVGLGIVVLRNVLERRGELALLLAVGFRKPTVQRLLLMENGALLAVGLMIGVVAAAIAVLPAMFSPTNELPYGSLAVTLGAVLLNGGLWTWAATRVAVRGDLLQALRNE